MDGSNYPFIGGHREPGDPGWTEFVSENNIYLDILQ